MHTPLRIAVLECDTPANNTNAKYGGYRGVFESLLKSSAKALGQSERLSPDDLQISGWDVVNEQEYPKLEDIDAVLLTGSSALSLSATLHLCLLLFSYPLLRSIVPTR